MAEDADAGSDADADSDATGALTPEAVWLGRPSEFRRQTCGPLQPQRWFLSPLSRLHRNKTYRLLRDKATIGWTGALRPESTSLPQETELTIVDTIGIPSWSASTAGDRHDRRRGDGCRRRRRAAERYRMAGPFRWGQTAAAPGLAAGGSKQGARSPAEKRYRCRAFGNFGRRNVPALGVPAPGDATPTPLLNRQYPHIRDAVEVQRVVLSRPDLLAVALPQLELQRVGLSLDEVPVVGEAV